ncbi:hypothetical protein [Aetokthonos hydrillicola]|nr:hypothetical protein [Aetokthonos hydrillicola]MBO3463959.1 hypothetical protein [Aetokthonos hydrillicola CCALA 1050]MBW4583979.1 hypothetical protein [Aetokthonos hydrillicola CCALA 1050]
MMQPIEVDNAIAQFQPSQVTEFELKQPISQSSAIGIQAAEINQLTTMSMKETPIRIFFPCCDHGIV